MTLRSGLSKFWLWGKNIFEFVKNNSIEVNESGRGIFEKLGVVVRHVSFKVCSCSWQKYRRVIYIFLIVAVSSVISMSGWLVVGMVVDLKDSVVSAAGDGMEDMRAGIDQLKNENFSQAAIKFADADKNLEEIELKIEKTGYNEQFLSQSMAGNQMSEISNVLSGMKSLMRGAKFMALSLAEIQSVDDKGSFAGLFFGMILGEMEKDDLFLKLTRAGEYLSMSSNELNIAVEKLDQVNIDLLPEKYRELYESNMQDIPRYLNILRGLNVLIADSGFFLGENVPAKYLLLFQNTNELRPTGGFIGSYGVLTMKNGMMEDLKFDDVYNPDGQITQNITPPYPVWYMTEQWGMRDSNWDPDFPGAANQAVKMFEKGGGYSVDGVVAFTPKIIEKLLELTGPIYMVDYDVELSSENFVSEVQREVELDHDKELNAPKKILSDFLPELMARLAELDESKKKQLWTILMELLNNKDVLVFFYDKEVEDMLQNIGWGGEIEQVDINSDYLYMVHANIGGRKSDEFIKESVNHKVFVQSDGTIEIDLEIIRRNIDDWSWPNYPNFDYLRVYVPRGSELLEVDGFVNPEGIIINQDKVIDYDVSRGEAGLANTKIYEDHGKEVFANWIVTDPYNASRVRYRYRLPFKIDDWGQKSYEMYLQKQPGRENLTYQLVVKSDVGKIVNSETNEVGDLVINNQLEKDLQLKIDFK